MRVNLVFGKAQQGKTTLALKRLLSTSPRLMVLDPVRSRPFTKAIEQRDVQAFTTWDALAGFLVSDDAGGKWRAVLRSVHETDYAHALRASEYLRHVDLLVDEGLWFCSSSELRPLLVHVARTNSHFGGGIGVPLWITAQRPMDLPPDIRSQGDRFISFRQEEPRDLQFLSERCSPEFAEQVAGLGEHEHATYPPLEGRTQHEADASHSVRGGRGSRVAGGVSDVPGYQRHQQASARRVSAA